MAQSKAQIRKMSEKQPVTCITVALNLIELKTMWEQNKQTWLVNMSKLGVQQSTRFSFILEISIFYYTFYHYDSFNYRLW